MTTKDTIMVHPTLSRMRDELRLTVCKNSLKSAKNLTHHVRKWGYETRRRIPETSAQWRERQSLRTAQPEFKRALKDLTFRKSFLAKLKRDLKKTSTIQPGIDGMIHWIDNRRTLEATIAELSRQITALGGKPPQAKPTQSAIVPISEADCRQIGASLNLQGKDATIIPCYEFSRLESSAPVTQWKNGRPRTVSRAKRNNYVRSFGTIVDDRTAEFAFDKLRRSCTLPVGYGWKLDAHGLAAHVVGRIDHDYHITATDVLTLPNCQWSQYLAERIATNVEQRRLAALTTAASLAEMADVYVCRRDSLDAGNCAAGTASWIRLQGITETHIPAVELAKRATESRVKIVINTAIRRHRQELAAGVCELANHR